MTKHIKTLACEITDETYSIAVACLPAAFATIGLDLVMGNYLVINAIDTVNDEQEMTQRVGLTNMWVPAELFREEYEFVVKTPGRQPKGVFREAVKMRDAEVKNREPAVRYAAQLPGQHISRAPRRYGRAPYSN